MGRFEVKLMRAHVGCHLVSSPSQIRKLEGDAGGIKVEGGVGWGGGSEERLFLSLISVMSERKRMEEGRTRHRCTQGFLRGLSRSGLLAIFESHLADRISQTGSSFPPRRRRQHEHTIIRRSCLEFSCH